METNEVSKTVLVVDDEVHIVNVVALKLRGAGYRVLTARDGNSGSRDRPVIGPELQPLRWTEGCIESSGDSAPSLPGDALIPIA